MPHSRSCRTHHAARRRKRGRSRAAERLFERVFHFWIAPSRLTYEPTETKHRISLQRTSYCSNSPYLSTRLSAAHPQKGHGNSCAAFVFFLGALAFDLGLKFIQTLTIYRQSRFRLERKITDRITTQAGCHQVLISGRPQKSVSRMDVR